jgi:hypothetical protein
MQLTTLGLTATAKHSRVYPITLEDSPQQVYKVRIKSLRLGTEIIKSFITSTQAANYVESMNDNQYFLVNRIK